MKAWMNGKMVDWRETHVPLLSHAFSRATAVFEVLEVKSTQKGTICFGLRQHMDRFFNSAALISMEIPFTKEALMDGIVRCIRENRLAEGMIKLFAYFEGVAFDLIPSSSPATVTIFAIDSKTLEKGRTETEMAVNVGISTVRKNHPESMILSAKVTGNYLNAYLATLEVRKRGYQEAILLDTMGYVAEGPTANVFMVKNRQIATPYLRCALPGITRSVVIKALREMNYVIREADLKGDELGDADEAFFTSGITSVQPIRSINGRKIGKSCPGPVTTVLINRLVDICEGHQPTFKDYLTLVPVG